MNEFLVILLQCSAFLFIPGVTFGLGVWLIVRYLGHQHKFAALFYALLVGTVAFEASFIGMAMDPGSIGRDWTRLFTTAALIGIGTCIFVLVLTPVYVSLTKIFRR